MEFFVQTLSSALLCFALLFCACAHISLFIFVDDVAIQWINFTLDSSSSSSNNMKKTAAFKLYYMISSSYTRTYANTQCTNVFQFSTYISVSLFQFIIFFYSWNTEKVSYQAHFFSFHTAKQLFVLTFCITCKWVVLNALQLTMGITIGIVDMVVHTLHK